MIRFFGQPSGLIAQTAAFSRLRWLLVGAALAGALGWGWPDRQAGVWGPAAALIGLLLLTAAWVLLGRLRATLHDTDVAAGRVRELFDALPLSIALFDADDRLVLCNRSFKLLYNGLEDQLQPGQRFEDLIRAAVGRGLVPDAKGREPLWIAERLRAHRSPGAPLVSQGPDASWRRVVEQRLADGSVLGYSVDVTDLIQREQAIDTARLDADLARSRLRDAINALPACFELYDAEDRLVLYNQALVQRYPHMAPYLPQHLSFEALARLNIAGGGQPQALGHEEAWITTRQAQRRAPQPGQSVLIPTADGGWLRMFETRLKGGGVVAIRVDVSELEAQRQALVEAHARAELASQRLEDAIEALPTGFELYDAEDRLVLCNDTQRSLYPHVAALTRERPTFEALVRQNFAAGGLPAMADDFEGWLAERIARRKQPGEPRLHQVGDGRWIRTYERRTREGGLVGVRIDVTEIVEKGHELQRLNTELDRANVELARLSDTDSLTGLANRRHFDRRLTEEWSRSRRHGLPLALLLIDIDEFKRFNDDHGHPAGDAVLRAVAEALRVGARRAGDLVARYGGEEFAVLLPHCDEAEARQQAQRCLAAVETLAIHHGSSAVAAVLTVSIGIATADGIEPAAGAADLVAAADTALYGAKRGGRRQVVTAPGRHGGG
jgi:diguanylate cyclase (GGDEF)-like protein